jgi:hypothetical protein
MPSLEAKRPTVKLTKAQRASVIRAKAQRKAKRSGKWSRYQRNIDQFVGGLKACGLWDKMSAVMLPGPAGFMDLKDAEGDVDG